MPEFPHHRSLRLQNFTVFKDAEFEFVPGVNALIGENGAGKTHLLKVLYAFQKSVFPTPEAFLRNYSNVFQLTDISDVIRHLTIYDVHAEVEGQWDSAPWGLRIERATAGIYRKEREHHVIESNNGKRIDEYSLGLTQPGFPKMTRPLFIPAIDMMAHTRRFVATYDEYNIDFDQTHRDIVAALLSPERREKPTDNEIYQILSRALKGGEVEEEGERFFLRTPQGRFPMPLVAEGLRKIATLQQLLKNGFLRPGDTLFWDEPEVNLNPKLMENVVAVLLALARSGVQIFLATHSYVILKELDLQAKKDDSVRFFALEPNVEEGTKVHMSDDFAQLEPNAILEQFDSLYDRELTRSTGRKRSK